MTPQITLTEKQVQARALAQSEARFMLFRGGSRSGKTFAICFFILMRALVTPNSRHGIFRQTAVDVRRTLFDLTFYDMMEKTFPGLWSQLADPPPGKRKFINDTEMTIELPNGSIIMFEGLDDATKQDRILGNEFATVYVSEVSQFREFDIFQKLIGRLNQELPMKDGKKLAPKLFLDCNPTTQRHWTYKAFIEGINPISGEPWPRRHEWGELQMNPIDNIAYNSSTYLNDLENLSARDRKRFLEGEWQAENDNAMFIADWWAGDAAHRRLKAMSPHECTHLSRIIVAVDPAGSSRPGSDETGIIVVGQDDQGECYVLEDCSGRYQPPEWAARAIDAYERWQADSIVTEDNYGKEMVPNTIRMLDGTVPIKCVSALRGKVIRAGPVALLYEQGKIHHCGTFEKLEGQLEDFHIDWNRSKDGSPDRLDALVWGITELAVKERKGSGATQQLVAGFWR